MPFRLIPRLDIKGPNLVKGIRLEGLRVLGPPDLFARAYASEGADELLYMDAVASLYGRNSLLDFISRMAQSIFIPITVGGGIRTEADVQQVLLAGADKVAVNTAAIETPGLIDGLAKRFGSSTIVLSIEAKRHGHGRWTAYSNNGRDNTGRDAFEWAREAVDRGAGEVIVTAVDREGTGRGFDLDLARAMTESLSVPVVICGGAGSVDDVVAAAGAADAVSLASVLHYDFVERLETASYEFGSGGEFRIVENKRRQSTIQATSLKSIKQVLGEKGFVSR
jgi:cyclase